MKDPNPHPPSPLAVASSLLALAAWLAAGTVFAFGQAGGAGASLLRSVGLPVAALLDLAAFLLSIIALLNRDRSWPVFYALIASLGLVVFTPFAFLFLLLARS